MCAIFGGYQLGRESLEKMSAAMLHRGPDGRALSEENGWSLGMNRLAIMDVQNGQQPFISNDGRVRAYCNGEIYNWQELRAELEKKGHTFHTQCDCEVIPAGWQEWGTGLFLKLNGMFALVIQEGDRIVLARDRCGQKPLYYKNSDGFIFSSEIRGLRAVTGRAEVDPSALHEYFMLRYVSEPRTLYRDIRMLPAGSYYESHTNEISSYWRPEFSERLHSYEDAVDQLESLTQEAVARTLKSDVPSAVYLSAGVDSSLLAQEIKNQGASPQTISIGFGADSDEVREAASFAASLGMPNYSVQCRAEDLSSLPRVAAQMERPVGDLLTIAFDKLASTTHSLGYKVAIGGEGADELFGGYSFQKSHALFESLGPIVTKAAALGVKSAPVGLLDKLAAFPAHLGSSGRAKVADFLWGYAQADEWWRGIGLRTLFTPVELADLLSPDVLESLPDLPHYAGAQSDVERHLCYQFDGWLQDWSLIRQDKNAMAHSVEYRAPFLDTQLIDFSFRLPIEWKLSLRLDKRIWRDMAGKRIAANVSGRAKQPFYLPLEQEAWRRVLWPWIDEALSPNGLQSTGWFLEDGLQRLRKKAELTNEFLPLKQLASLAILYLHISQ